MVITVHYEEGIDVFDTAERVSAPACSGNALTNWSLKLEDAREGDEFGGRRLWLRLYAHDLPGDDGSAGAGDLPAAARRDVACFLVADESDVARLLRVRVDGETVLSRVGGELVNADRLAYAADLVEARCPQAVDARRALDAAAGDDFEGDPEVTACAAIGFTPESYLFAERVAEACWGF